MSKGPVFDSVEAFTEWELGPAPCDGSPEGSETRSGSTEGNSAVDEASSEVEAPDPSETPTLKAEIERMKAVLAESERKRVEERTALTVLYVWYDRDGSVGGASDVFAEHRRLIASTGEADHANPR